MKGKFNFLGIAAGFALALGLTNAAQAATISTSGVWTGATGNTIVNGVGTSQLSWGIPAQGQQSSYVFEGVNNLDLPLDGTKFLLGTFTHNNFPIFSAGGSITGADLALSLDVTNGGIFSQVFNLNFAHNETPNDGVNGSSGTCSFTPGFAPPCPDIVSIPNPAFEEMFKINGHNYKFLISGFQQGGQIVDEFITSENQSNSAQIFGHLQKVPEPVTGIGATTAIGGLFWLTKRKKAAIAK